jgi:poly(3-hydroxybutyrate) depolymerase
MPPRKVKLALASSGGPLVLYWHATGSSPAEARYALGATHDAILSDGGIIATPYSDAAAGTFEWFIVNGSSKLDDFVLADEIVGCLAQAGRIDVTRIHSMGMSAGALQTTAFSFVRSAYVASVATYSGGLPPGVQLAMQEPSNKFAALIFDGGTADNVFGVDFKAASENYRTVLAGNGHFAALCEHTQGHEIPLDAAPSVYAMFRAHPFATSPSPYASGLPSSFPTYCGR